MSKSMPKSPRFQVGLVGDFQFIDEPECLSSWKVQGTDLENGLFLYFAACFFNIIIIIPRWPWPIRMILHQMV